MKNIIIIGRPRAGKSTLANMIADKYNYQIIRTDAIRNTFRDVLPELNIRPHTAIESEKFQMFIKEFLRLNIKQARNKYSFVMEGCETSVKDCKEIYDNEDNLIYVLAQKDITPEKMASDIKKYDTEKDWTYEMSYNELIKYCTNSIQKAKIIYEECKKYGLKFFDTSVNREKVLNDIMKDIEANI